MYVQSFVLPLKLQFNILKGRCMLQLVDFISVINSW